MATSNRIEGKMVTMLSGCLIAWRSAERSAFCGILLKDDEKGSASRPLRVSSLQMALEMLSQRQLKSTGTPASYVGEVIQEEMHSERL